MVSNLLKRVGFVGLALLMLSGTLINIFAFKQTAHAADPYNWVDGSGKKIDGKTVDWTKRLKFLSPFDIYDSTTKTTYTTKDKVFGTGSSNLIKEGDGYYVYLPTGKSSNYVTPDNSDCYGVFIWYVTGKNTYSHLEIVQPEISSGKSGCSIEGKSISESSNTSINPNGSELRIINDEDGNWGNYKGIADWLVAPMYWASKDQVSYFNSTYTLTKVTKGDSTYDNITKLLGTKVDKMKSSGHTEFEYWKMGKCNNEYLVTELLGTKVSSYGYIMHFNGDPVSGGGDAGGTEYYDIGGNGGSNCMTGRDIRGPSYDVINYGDYPAGKNNQVPISYAPQINEPATNPAITAPVTTTPAGDGGVLEESCWTSGGAFAFILCPVLEAIDKLTSWAEGVIANQLDVDLGSKEDRGYLEDTWLRMARIASILLVIIALVMVTSTALGFGLFNAYTVKKVMPRIVIGAVAMWFSWAIVTYYIDFINVLGKELASIMLSQFGEEAKNFSLTNIAAAAMKEGGDGSSALFTALSIGSIAAVGWLGIGGLALTAGLAFVVAIATLAVRKAIIIFLVILSPLAIAAWILPNTQSAWKKWSSTLNKLLLMYPMIMGLLAAGKIFALVSARTATEAEKGTLDNFFGIAIAVIAYVGPLFMIPGLIKTSGNVMGKVSGGLGKLGGNATKGMRNSLDSAKSARNKVRAENRSIAQRNRQLNGASVFGLGVPGSRSLARATGRVRAGQAAIPMRAGSRAAARLDASRASQASVLDAQKRIDDVIGNDSDAREAIASGQSMAQLQSNTYTDSSGIVRNKSEEQIRKDQSTAMRMRQSGADRLLGDKYAQAGATLGLASQGRAKSADIAKIAENFSGDPQTASSLVGQATRSAKGSGQVSIGAMKYDFSTGKVGYEGPKIDPSTGAPVVDSQGKIVTEIKTDESSAQYVEAKQKQVLKVIVEMSAADKANLGVKLSDDGTRLEFKDKGVQDALVQDALQNSGSTGATIAMQIHNDPSLKLTEQQKQALMSIINSGAQPPSSPIPGGGFED